MKKYHALSNFEINSYFSGRPEYGGTYSKDMLPNKMENKFYIINLDDSTGLGSHWTMIAPLKRTIYFDAFGAPPPVNALRFMKTRKNPMKSEKTMYYSTLQLQDIKSSLCGYYCIYIIDQITSGRDFLDIISQDFNNDEAVNDKYIMKYFKNVHF